MKLRALLVVLLIVAGGAVAVWFWPAVSEKPAPVSVPQLPAASPLATTSSVPPSASPTPQPEATPAGPTPPVRFDSPVMPGQPVYRSGPASPNRVVPAAAPGSAAFATMKEPEGKEEIENVRAMFTNYVARMGEIPIGTNAEIMKSVMGENRDRITLGPPHGQGLNEAGELVDRWGTPYFFHQMAKDSMEVRSAGPDKLMWTADDLVTK